MQICQREHAAKVRVGWSNDSQSRLQVCLNKSIGCADADSAGALPEPESVEVHAVGMYLFAQLYIRQAQRPEAMETWPSQNGELAGTSPSRQSHNGSCPLTQCANFHWQAISVIPSPPRSKLLALTHARARRAGPTSSIST